MSDKPGAPAKPRQLRSTSLRDPAALGVDLEEALRRVGDRELLDELLEQFAQTWRDGAARIETAVTAGDLMKAQAIVHTLWGVSATLAVCPVRDSAARLQEYLRAGTDAKKEIVSEVAVLGVALATFLKALRDSPAGG